MTPSTGRTLLRPRRAAPLAAAAALATFATLAATGGGARPAPPPRAVAHAHAPPACRADPPPQRASQAVVETLPRRGHEPHANLVVTTPRPWVALTFDDGPWPATTPAVLRILRRFHAHATFFVVGMFATRYPDLLRREHAAGDDVANHTAGHPPLTDASGSTRLSRAGIRREIRGGRDAICRAGLPAPAFFRPPYGRGLFNREIAQYARAARERTIGWDIALDRYLLRVPTVEDAVSALVARVRPGTIIVAHDGHIGGAAHPGTLRALSLLLADLRARGLQAVSLGRLLG